MMKTGFSLSGIIDSAVGDAIAVSPGYGKVEIEKKVNWESVSFAANGRIIESGSKVSISVEITPPEKAQPQEQ